MTTHPPPPLAACLTTTGRLAADPDHGCTARSAPTATGACHG